MKKYRPFLFIDHIISSTNNVPFLQCIFNYEKKAFLPVEEREAKKIMVYYSDAVIRADHFVVELRPSAKECFLQAIKSIGPSQKVSRTLTESNIPGIESLSFSTTYENIVLRNNFGKEYISYLNDEFELVINGSYSNYMVNFPFSIINKKHQWSLNCKICFTLNPYQLNQKGLYLVASIPFYGIQVVINYNSILKDIHISLRSPMFDGHDEDRNGASVNGCNLVCLNVDFSRSQIDQRTIEILPFAPKIEAVQPRPSPPVQKPEYIPPSNGKDVQPKPSPPAPQPGYIPPGDGNDFKPQPPGPRTASLKNSPPAIPTRPVSLPPSTNATYSSYNYRTQETWSISPFGLRTTSTVYNSESRVNPNPSNTYSRGISQQPQGTPPPPYTPPSNSAPTTPATPQPAPAAPRPTPAAPRPAPAQQPAPPVRTEGMRNAFGKLDSGVNKSLNVIDNFFTKASNSLSSSKNRNQNNNNNIRK